MKLTMSTSVIAGNFLRIKLEFTFVTLVSLKSDKNLKLNEGSGRFIMQSN